MIDEITIRFVGAFVLAGDRYFNEEYNKEILKERVKPNWQCLDDIILDPVINIVVVHAGEERLKVFLEEIGEIFDGRNDFDDDFICCVVEHDKICIPIGGTDTQTATATASSESQTLNLPTYFLFYNDFHTIRFITYKLEDTFTKIDVRKLLGGIKSEKIYLTSIWVLFENEHDNKVINLPAEEFLSEESKFASERTMCINTAVRRTPSDLSLPANVEDKLRKICPLDKIEERKYVFYCGNSNEENGGEEIEATSELNEEEGRRLMDNILGNEFRAAMDLLAYPFLATIQFVLESSQEGVSEIEVIPLNRKWELCMHKRCCPLTVDNLPLFLPCVASSKAVKNRNDKCVKCRHPNHFHVEVSSTTKRMKKGRKEITQKIEGIKEFCLKIQYHLKRENPILLIIETFENLFSEAMFYNVYREMSDIRVHMLNKWKEAECTIESICKNFASFCSADKFGRYLKTLFLNEFNTRYFEVHKPGMLLEKAQTSVGLPGGKIYVKHSEGNYSKIMKNKRTGYKTVSRNRGYALVINNIQFENHEDLKKPLSERVGAEHDEENLRELFSQMCYWKFKMKRNLKKNEMLTAVDELLEDFEEEPFDIIMLFVMSHGVKMENSTGIYGSDSELVNEYDIINKLSQLHVTCLLGIPKITVFNCCRGSANEYEGIQGGGEIDLEKASENPNIKYSDICIIHSTLMEHQSVRDPDGTVYIKALCEVFAENAYNTHVRELFSLVSEKLDLMKRGQTSVYEETSFRECYLHPGYHEDETINN